MYNLNSKWSFFGRGLGVNPCGNGSKSLMRQMNKHEGRDVDEYLKERGIFDEVDSLTQQELEALRDQDSLEIIETPPSYVSRFLQWLRHAFNV